MSTLEVEGVREGLPIHLLGCELHVSCLSPMETLTLKKRLRNVRTRVALVFLKLERVEDWRGCGVCREAWVQIRLGDMTKLHWPLLLPNQTKPYICTKRYTLLQKKKMGANTFSTKTRPSINQSSILEIDNSNAWLP